MSHYWGQGSYRQFKRPAENDGREPFFANVAMNTNVGLSVEQAETNLRPLPHMFTC
ncbi:MAG: hypothetical protein AB3N12_03570 [Ruegeria sp.]